MQNMIKVDTNSMEYPITRNVRDSLSQHKLMMLRVCRKNYYG